MNRKAIFPGTFDPFTKGHLDIVERGLKLFDEIIIVIAYNEQKQTLFSLDERRILIEQSIQHLPNVSIVTQKGGLVVNAGVELGAQAVLRGVRNETDMMFEQRIALYGLRANDAIETVCLFTRESLTLVSSSNVKEFYRTGGDVSDMVDLHVIEALDKKMRVEKVEWDAH